MLSGHAPIHVLDSPLIAAVANALVAHMSFEWPSAVRAGGRDHGGYGDDEYVRGGFCLACATDLADELNRTPQRVEKTVWYREEDDDEVEGWRLSEDEAHALGYEQWGTATDLYPGDPRVGGKFYAEENDVECANRTVPTMACLDCGRWLHCSFSKDGAYESFSYMREEVLTLDDSQSYELAMMMRGVVDRRVELDPHELRDFHAIVGAARWTLGTRGTRIG